MGAGPQINNLEGFKTPLCYLMELYFQQTYSFSVVATMVNLSRVKSRGECTESLRWSEASLQLLLGLVTTLEPLRTPRAPGGFEQSPGLPAVCCCCAISI